MASKFNKLGAFFQFLTFVVLLIALIFTGIGLCIHNRYYRNTVRPYIDCIPSPKVKAKNGALLYKYSIINTGQTPAFKTVVYSEYTLGDEDFPTHLFVKSIQTTINPTKEIISRDMKEEYIVPKKLMIDKALSRGELLRKLINKEIKIYAHYYIEYYDVNKRKYHFRKSFYLDFRLKNDTDTTSAWVFLDVSEEPIKLINSRIH